MKKIIKMPILLLLMMLGFSTSFFALFNFRTDVKETVADIAGVSGDVICLTGTQGYKPFHYFVDENSNSLLICASGDTANEYYNENGELVSKYYAISGSSEVLSNKKSSGSAKFILTDEMNNLAKAGVLYVQASGGIISRDSDQNDKVKVTLTNGDNALSFTSTKVQKSGVANPEWLKTDFIKVAPDEIIKYSFETLAEGGRLNNCRFEIYEPKLIFKIIVDEMTFESESESVYPGQILDLLGSNVVLEQTGNSEYMKTYKNLFKVNYQVTKGLKYASISSGKLLVKTSAPDNEEITVSASIRRDSIDGGTISKSITFKVNAKRYQVSIQSDFSSPATFVGNGNFYEGQKITLKATPNPGYTFKKWVVNGKNYTTTSVSYKVGKVNNIFAQFVKGTKVLSISGVTKIYDGSQTAEITAVLDGIEQNHDVRLGGITAKYISADAAANKKLIFEGVPELIGENKDLYELTSFAIPDGYGTIEKRNITITANSTSKIYGDKNEKILYQTTEPEFSLNGELDRVQGEDVGVYEINAGSLAELNPNFNINFISSQFEIKPKELNIEFQPIEKIYDKSDEAQVSYSITNKAYNDEISLNIVAKYASNEAGMQKINFSTLEILGEKASNYIIPELNIYGNILPKEIVVTADNKEKVFGYEDPQLTYSVTGKIEGDELSGRLSREPGSEVGVYDILLNNVGNPNYKINFISADFVITKRDVNVIANAVQKTYGDNDPELTYVTENAVSGVTINGTLKRQTGENIGDYQISIGSLSNSNYNITFVPNQFKIIKRQATVNIEVLNKDYDGNVDAQYNYTISNLSSLDEITASFILKFDNKNTGDRRATVESSNYYGEAAGNYDFVILGGLSAKINKKNININIQSVEKIYGESDPELVYSFDGVIGDDVVWVNIQRDIGENVGTYSFVLNSVLNDNYNVCYNDIATLKILPKTLNVKAVDCSKVFGDSDPEFNFVISQNLAFNDKISDVITGNLSREAGNNPAMYEILIGTLKSSENYKIEFTKGYLTITKKDIVIRAKNAEKVYGEEDPSFEYTLENIVEGSNVVLNLRREYGEDVGEYVITYSSLIDPRYNIEFVNAKLTITPRAIKVKADEKFKFYGDNDPEFSVSVIEGELQFNDDPTEISVGEMIREKGEQAGSYKINIGTYSLGKNYTTSFESGNLTVVRAEIEISANQVTKKYGNQDGELTFEISKGELKFEDQVSGNLARTQGEGIGSYQITIGDLSINENYAVTFIPAQFIIEKRPIEIRADAVSKIFGETDPELTYTIVGGTVGGDLFEGELTREKPKYDQDPDFCEYAGRYLITSTLENDNYEITYISNYLTIKQREIFITADNKSKYYGENDPELTYKITSGEILDGATLQGNIYRFEGNDAGKYDIRSNLTLGRNYKIVFTKGVFEIKQLIIKVKTYDYEKIYGEVNPTFEYEILEGELLNGDVLLGGVSKEPGEDVGTYRLVSAFNNTNYNVELTENYLTIKPKNAYLSVAIQDKVYNGDTVAYIRQPSVTGLIDSDVTVSYDKENCARFISSEVGNHILVNLFDITLAGEKAGNYILNLPTEVYGNITNNKLATKDEKVMLETSTNTDLTKGSVLKAEDKVNAGEFENASKQVVCAYNVWLENAEVETELKHSITVKFELPSQFQNRNNFYVYGTTKDGETVLLNSKLNGDYLEVTTDCLGEFVVLSDNEKWINVSAYVSLGVVVLLATWLIVYETKKHKKKKMMPKIDI